jgi:hypothetical protein
MLEELQTVGEVALLPKSREELLEAELEGRQNCNNVTNKPS